MLTESEIANIADQILGRELGASGFTNADIESGFDHDGDPSLYVTVHFKPRSGVTEGAASTTAHAALRRRLLEEGEERFPYFRYRYPDDEVLIGEDEPETT